MRPQSIVRFEQAYLASIVLWFINLATNWNTRLATVERDPRFGGNPQMLQMAEWMMIGTAALGVLIWALLWYFTARRGANWARWVLVIFLAVSAIGLPFTLMNATLVGTIPTILIVTSFALNAVAVLMLFRPDAKIWFGGSPEPEEAAQPFE